MVQTRLHKHSLSKAEQAVSNVASRASVRDPINEFQEVYGSRAGSAAFRQQIGSDFSRSGQIQPPIQAKPSFRGLSQELAAESQPVQLREEENKTGLPDDLKAGVEALSGFSMDDVRVHYNSSKPSDLQALAYTQGMEIHVGPGQERYLAHEAWHVVQQMQGRVKPTMQWSGIEINDDEILEREAEAIGKGSAWKKEYTSTERALERYTIDAHHYEHNEEGMLERQKDMLKGEVSKSRIIQRYPHPYLGLSDTKNLYNARPESKKVVWDGGKPSFGDNLYTARCKEFSGGQTITMMGYGDGGHPTILMSGTQQLDHDPSWADRKSRIRQYGKELTIKYKNQTLTDYDKHLITEGYYIYVIRTDDYQPTLYAARMYYNDYDTIKPATGGANASAGSGSVAAVNTSSYTLGQEALLERFLRQLGDHLLVWQNEVWQYDVEDGEIYSQSLQLLYNKFDQANRMELDYIAKVYREI